MQKKCCHHSRHLPSTACTKPHHYHLSPRCTHAATARRHAPQVTDGCKSLVSSKFSSVGVSMYKEGALDAGVIEKDKLIDNHYYAIANKARAHP